MHSMHPIQKRCSFVLVGRGAWGLQYTAFIGKLEFTESSTDTNLEGAWDLVVAWDLVIVFIR